MQPELRPVYIYALFDPITHKPRYVGSTVNGLMRVSQHKVGPGSDTREWIRALRARNLGPALLVLETANESCRLAREEYWHRRLLAAGEPLLNPMLQEVGATDRGGCDRCRLLLRALKKAIGSLTCKDKGQGRRRKEAWTQITSRPDNFLLED